MLLQKFSFTETQDVMTLVHPTHGILFDATNVCEILEYSRKAGNVIEKLDDDEKVLLKREEYNPSSEVTPAVTSEFDRQKGAKSKWFVTEPGLYTLTLGSEKPQAKVFKRWITHEVIPALRRTGSYTMPTGNAQMGKESPLERMAKSYGALPTDIIKKEFDACLSIFTDFTDITGNHAKLAANRLFKQIYQIDILKTAEVDLPSKVQARCWYPTELGKRAGISAMKMNMILEMANLQTSSYHTGKSGKSHKVWTATEEGKVYSEYVDVGKEHSDGTPVQSLKWYETVLEHDKVKQLIAITITQKDKAAPATAKMTPSERLEHLHETRADENGLYTD